MRRPCREPRLAQKILLVDDESNIRDLNALYLEKEGFTVMARVVI